MGVASAEQGRGEGASFEIAPTHHNFLKSNLVILSPESVCKLSKMALKEPNMNNPWRQPGVSYHSSFPALKELNINLLKIPFIKPFQGLRSEG